jgi:uncharacterized tellurite resistance protein B-like protein
MGKFLPEKTTVFNTQHPWEFRFQGFPGWHKSASLPVKAVYGTSRKRKHGGDHHRSNHLGDSADGFYSRISKVARLVKYPPVFFFFACHINIHMNLLDIFKNDQEGVRRSYMKNLITVAMADGHLSEEEWEMLKALARVMGITEEEIISIREHPETVKFIPPKKYEDKVQHIQDLVAVMTVDDHINPKELELCKKIALKLDLLPQLVDEIVSSILHPNPAAGASAQ